VIVGPKRDRIDSWTKGKSSLLQKVACIVATNVNSSVRALHKIALRVRDECFVLYFAGQMSGKRMYSQCFRLWLGLDARWSSKYIIGDLVQLFSLHSVQCDDQLQEPRRDMSEHNEQLASPSLFCQTVASKWQEAQLSPRKAECMPVSEGQQLWMRDQFNAYVFSGWDPYFGRTGRRQYCWIGHR